MAYENLPNDAFVTAPDHSPAIGRPAQLPAIKTVVPGAVPKSNNATPLTTDPTNYYKVPRNPQPQGPPSMKQSKPPPSNRQKKLPTPPNLPPPPPAPQTSENVSNKGSQSEESVEADKAMVEPKNAESFKSYVS